MARALVPLRADLLADGTFGPKAASQALRGGLGVQRQLAQSDVRPKGGITSAARAKGVGLRGSG